MNMRALTFDPADDTFVVREIPVPEPGPDDVLVKVEACGLNPADAKIALWKKGVSGMNDGWTPGLDVSGTIAAVGDAVTAWKAGDRILCHGDRYRPHGGFAEYSVQEASTVLAHPDLPAAIAAATPCAGWTAWRALHDKLRATESDSLLITGGSGGVGGFAIQLARHMGLETIITTCSARNMSYVSRLGATHVIDYETEDPLARVLELTEGRGVTLALATVGPDNDIISANALAFEGQMVELVGVVRPERYRDVFSRGLTFHQLSLGAGHRNGPAGKARLLAAGKAFTELIERGLIGAPALETIPIDGVAPALREMLRQRTRGKIVMVW